MADASLAWGGDLVLTADGDIALAEGKLETEQSIVRRLFTAVQGYVWAPEYGAGLIQRIGKPAQTRVIASIVRSQIALEATVAALPVPTITVTEIDSNPGMFVINISYQDAITGAAVAISLEVPGAR